MELWRYTVWIQRRTGKDGFDFYYKEKSEKLVSKDKEIHMYFVDLEKCSTEYVEEIYGRLWTEEELRW